MQETNDLTKFKKDIVIILILKYHIILIQFVWIDDGNFISTLNIRRFKILITK